MKPKNVKRYKDEFNDISSDQITRIHDYLNSKKFSKKDIDKFYKRLKEIQSIESEYLKLVFDIIPEPTPRPRLGLFGRFYVKNSSTNNKFVELMVKSNEELFHFITTPCVFIVKNYFPMPKKFNKVDTLLAELGLISMLAKPDWDNLGKTYSDMVQKWILLNDSLIIDGRSEKYYSLKPRVEIIIKYKKDHDCIHSKRLVEQSISYKTGAENDESKETIV